MPLTKKKNGVMKNEQGGTGVFAPSKFAVKVSPRQISAGYDGEEKPHKVARGDNIKVHL
jgi:hypothetical protein